MRAKLARRGVIQPLRILSGNMAREPKPERRRRCSGLARQPGTARQRTTKRPDVLLSPLIAFRFSFLEERVHVHCYFSRSFCSMTSLTSQQWPCSMTWCPRWPPAMQAGLADCASSESISAAGGQALPSTDPSPWRNLPFADRHFYRRRLPIITCAATVEQLCALGCYLMQWWPLRSCRHGFLRPDGWMRRFSCWFCCSLEKPSRSV